MTQAEVPERFEAWAILELMGHRRLAGLVTEQEIAGQSFVRLDVHDEANAITTQFYSPSAVYCITPTTEEIARRIGANSKPAPVQRYELEPPRASSEYDIDDDEPF